MNNFEKRMAHELFEAEKAMREILAFCELKRGSSGFTNRVECIRVLARRIVRRMEEFHSYSGHYL